MLAQLRTMRFEREEEQEWLRELQQSLAHAEARAASQEARASSLEAAAQASSSALQQLEARAAELQEQLLLQRVCHSVAVQSQLDRMDTLSWHDPIIKLTKSFVYI